MFERNATVNVPGIGKLTVPILANGPRGMFVIALSGPLTVEEPLDEGIADIKEFSSVPVLLKDELLVRSNLPSVSSELLSSLT